MGVVAQGALARDTVSFVDRFGLMNDAGVKIEKSEIWTAFTGAVIQPWSDSLKPLGLLLAHGIGSHLEVPERWGMPCVRSCRSWRRLIGR